MLNAKCQGRTLRRGSAGARPPFNIYHLTFVISVLALPGCGAWNLGGRPALYRLQGRVVDGGTQQGLPNTRVLVRAAIPTHFGPRTLAAYAYTNAAGSYEAELSEGFEVIRTATGIHLEAGRGGYQPAGLDLPPPTQEQPVYKAPDLVLAPGGPSPTNRLPRGLNVPGLAPLSPGGPLPVGKPVPLTPPKPKPNQGAIQWE